MLNRQPAPFRCLAAAFLAGTLLMDLTGCDALCYYCGMSDDMSEDPSGGNSGGGGGGQSGGGGGGGMVMDQAPAALVVPAQVIGKPAPGQQTYASDQEAVNALLAAAKAQDQNALERILGPDAKELISSGDPVEDNRAAASFAEHAAQRTRLEKNPRINPQTTILHVGDKDWPMPIPVVQAADGKWFFDTAAGKQEVLARRIGHNELETIQVCRTYVQAQREYAAKDRDGSEVLKYAQRMVSHPGQKDGLYWAPGLAAAGEEQSPLGPLIAQATDEGYSVYAGHRSEPFFGYYYRILKQQGPAAPGGEYNYVINGNMIAGFALVAWPANYGSTGVMTFIISHQGKLYQKDLGAGTDAAARAMEQYNPDKTWSVVKD